MHLVRFYLLLFWIIVCPAIASESPSCKTNTRVFSKSGNIYYIQAPSHTTQITHSGKDSDSVLSLDKKWIAYVRIGNQIIPKGCNGDTETNYGNQIWIYNLATRKEKLLVANNFQCNKPEKQIIDPSELTFSPDSKILYFLTSAWTTSGALHGVNIDGTHQRYIAPANSFEVITQGTYKGYFIVNEHRYFIPPGGTYDWYWLVSPDGKNEEPFGEEVTNEQRNFLES
ncbi:MAG: hypothetical protein K0R24_977 [Gammaproteobacteria bacterium]|jgi:hypothetical protein|nr:hypothetical protein [Gammaproteobacteria bacterium]